MTLKRLNLCPTCPYRLYYQSSGSNNVEFDEVKMKKEGRRDKKEGFIATNTRKFQKLFVYPWHFFTILFFSKTSLHDLLHGP